MVNAESILDKILTDTYGRTVSNILKSNIENDIKKQENNHIYSDTLIREIIMGAQEFEYLMRKFIEDNEICFEGELWKSMSGKLLSKIEESGKFKREQISVLKQIKDLRNWVVHEVYKEEQDYKKEHEICSVVIDYNEWLKYYTTKLSITKYLIYEAIDFYVGAENVISLNE